MSFNIPFNCSFNFNISHYVSKNTVCKGYTPNSLSSKPVLLKKGGKYALLNPETGSYKSQDCKIYVGDNSLVCENCKYFVKCKIVDVDCAEDELITQFKNLLQQQNTPYVQLLKLFVHAGARIQHQKQKGIRWENFMECFHWFAYLQNKLGEKKIKLLRGNWKEGLIGAKFPLPDPKTIRDYHSKFMSIDVFCSVKFEPKIS